MYVRIMYNEARGDLCLYLIAGIIQISNQNALSRQ